MFPLLRLSCLACTVIFPIYLLGASHAVAADFTVNSTADRVDFNAGDGVCSTGSRIDGGAQECTLRAAIDEVNALSKLNSVKVYSIAVAAGTYVLSTPETCFYHEPDNTNLLSRSSTSLCITGNLTLTGAAAASTLLDARLVDKLFYVGTTSTVAINNFTLQGGTNSGSTFDGGGSVINNQGTLSLANVVVTKNQAPILGGSIFTNGKLLVQNSIFDGNVGSAIRVNSSNSVAETSVSETYFRNNTGYDGAAIFAVGGASLRINNSTMAGNTAVASGIVFIDNTPTTIVNTTISFNTVQGGGVVVGNANANRRNRITLNNDTIYGNRVTGTLGALEVYEATVSNSILSGNAPLECSVVEFSDLGHNIIGGVVLNMVTECATAPSTLIGADAKLGPLQVDGGTLPTQTPLPGSAALESGSAAIPGSSTAGACAKLDQRGSTRSNGRRCSIGAAEPLSGLTIANIQPNSGGSPGTVSIVVNGSGFIAGSTLSFRKGGVEIKPTQSVLGEDQTLLTATFDLSGAPLGGYDVVVQTPRGSAVLAGGFSVQKTLLPEVYSYVTGETSGREGRPNFYTMVYGNKGNVDAYLVPLTVSLPGYFVGTFYSAIVPPPQGKGRPVQDWTRVPVEVNPYSLAGFSNVPLVIPVIPANSQGILFFSLTPPANSDLAVPYTFFASLGEPYGSEANGALTPDSLAKFVAGAKSYANTYLGGALSDQAVSTMADYARAQLRSVVTQGQQALLSSASAQGVFFSNSQLTIDTAEFGVSLTTNGVPPKSTAPRAAPTSVLSPRDGNNPNDNPEIGPPSIFCIPGEVLREGQSCEPNPTGVPHVDRSNDKDGKISRSDCVSELNHEVSPDGKTCRPIISKGCRPIPNPLLGADPNCGTYPIRASLDPNKKDGPLGVGAEHFTQARDSFLYQIEFENKSTATASAQTVSVTDQLDSTRFDLSTFELGPISFGPVVITPPSGLSSYSTAIDLRPSQNVILSIRANLNKTSGIVTWNFESLDPATLQLTTDGNAGFLPPDKQSPEGIGHVAFMIHPIDRLGSGSRLCNTAIITFDTNAPITTPPFCNSKDTAAPASHVLPLSGSPDGNSLLLSWTGSDAESGIQSYTIYSSDNRGPFRAFTTNTAATSARFTGASGHEYGFYSIATDRLGNTEAPKQMAEVTITLGTTATIAVPKVVGLSKAAAINALDQAHLRLGAVTLQPSATIPAGTVAAENPPAGTVVKSNSAVDLVISSGVQKVSVPSVVGQPQSAAEAAVRAAGLVVGTITINITSSAVEGTVLSENPAAGTLVVANSAVDLVVSGGTALQSGFSALISATQHAKFLTPHVVAHLVGLIEVARSLEAAGNRVGAKQSIDSYEKLVTVSSRFGLETSQAHALLKLARAIQQIL